MSSANITIQIDKGIPVPDSRQGRSGDFNFAVSTALAKMGAGDSFVYSDGSKSRSRALIVRYVAQKAGVKVVIRKISESNFRVWRSE